ncbi:MAG: chloride channel protein [Myxococcaceae bacterium]
MRSPLAALKSLGEAARTHARALLLRYMPSEAQHVFALTLVIGVVCGLAAVGFHLSIRFAESHLIDRAMAAPGYSWVPWTLATPLQGALAAGALLNYVVPLARGSGVPQVKQAFAIQGGRIRLRDTLGKFAIGVLQIGSGASLGREGPTVHLCAGLASALGRATSLPPKSVRRLMPVGVAAGIAAAFNAPIAAVTFTIEEIVGTLDQTVLSGVVVAAALAAVIERSVLGVNPIIQVAQPYGLDHASSLVFYAALGVAAAWVSVTFTDSLLSLRAWFRTVKRLPRFAHPAVGGLVTGILAVVALHFMKTTGVTGGGYHTLGLALSGSIAVEVLIVLGAMKLVATVFSYSSGGAGGIFAPSLFIGAMLGGAVGYLDIAVLGHENGEVGAFALVGMGAVFAGTIRAPITSVLIIFEMTGGYGLVLPLMIANMTAYGLARHYRPTPIYEALLEQDGVHLPHLRGAVNHALERLQVVSAMTPDPLWLPSSLTVAEAVERLKARGFSTVPVLGETGGFLGLVGAAALRAASVEGGARPVGELVIASEPIAASAPLIQAVMRMNGAKVRQLAVVDPSDGNRLVGLLAMSDVVRAHAAAASEATEEEKGGAQPAAPVAPVGAGAAAERARDPLLQTKVRLLCAAASPVPAATHLSALVELLVSAKDGALPVLDRGGALYGIALLDQVRDLWQDEQLDGVLVATDVARKVAAISPDSDLAGALRVMDAEGVGALPVGGATQGERPGSVITRAEIGRFLFGQYLRPKGKAGRAPA